MIPFTPDGSFEHMCNPESTRDLAQVASVISSILHYGGSANDFEFGDPGEMIENLILDSVRKVSVIFVRADVVKGKDRDAFFGRYRFNTPLVEPTSSIWGKEGPGD